MSDYAIQGFHEALLICRNPAPHIRILSDLGGWELAGHWPLGPEQLAAWGLDLNASGWEWLMICPGAPRGAIRLVLLEGCAQRQLRPNDQPWEPGGIFDLNLRVRDLDRCYRYLMDEGWQGYTDPAQFQLGSSLVKEWLVRGPDGVRYALIERLDPPLSGFDHMRGFSQVFNSTQIVADMAQSMAFYRDVLGFTLTLQTGNLNTGPGPNPLGLPFSIAHRCDYSLAMLHAQQPMDGSVELVSFKDWHSRDFSRDAGPPNLGMAALRFPVKDIDALHRRLQREQVPIVISPRELTLQGIGRVRLLGALAPEGAWLEFFQPLD